MKPRVKSSVSVVKIDDHNIEFFLSDIREIQQIKVGDSDLIIKLIRKMDGSKSIKELSEVCNINEKDLNNFVSYLKSKNYLSVDNLIDDNDYKKYKRVIHFLSNYFSAPIDILKSWNQLKNSTVVIVGAGTVGTWVTINLVQSGVTNFIIIDDDNIEYTNLQRQVGYFYHQIGEKKVETLKNRLLDINPKINVKTFDSKIYSSDDLENLINYKPIDLIINCSDFPTVDETSTWVGEYCMPRKIPHIIGGGYNLHASLIGQTIIPFESACFKCFEKNLNEEQALQFKSLKKMEVSNRKIGNIGPASNIIASFIGMEAVKILAKIITPGNLNRRGEFNILTMDLSFKNFEKDKNCPWCGDRGIYKC